MTEEELKAWEAELDPEDPDMPPRSQERMLALIAEVRRLRGRAETHAVLLANARSGADLASAIHGCKELEQECEDLAARLDERDAEIAKLREAGERAIIALREWETHAGHGTTCIEDSWRHEFASKAEDEGRGWSQAMKSYLCGNPEVREDHRCCYGEAIRALLACGIPDAKT